MLILQCRDNALAIGDVPPMERSVTELSYRLTLFSCETGAFGAANAQKRGT
jgi:hypothetical protein